MPVEVPRRAISSDYSHTARRTVAKRAGSGYN